MNAHLTISATAVTIKFHSEGGIAKSKVKSLPPVRVEEQGLTFGQWYKHAKNMGVRYGRKAPGPTLALEAYCAGFLPTEILYLKQL